MRVPMPVFRKMQTRRGRGHRRLYNHYSLLRMFSVLGPEWCVGGSPRRGLLATKAVIGVRTCRRAVLDASHRSNQTLLARLFQAVAIAAEAVRAAAAQESQPQCTARCALPRDAAADANRRLQPLVRSRCRRLGTRRHARLTGRGRLRRLCAYRVERRFPNSTWAAAKRQVMEEGAMKLAEVLELLQPSTFTPTTMFGAGNFEVGTLPSPLLTQNTCLRKHRSTQTLPHPKQ